MATSGGVWGIDLGQCALKAVRLSLNAGNVQATAFDYIEYPKILSQPDADPDLLIREALEQFLSRNKIKGDQVVIGVPGQSGLARFVKLPPVEEKKIADIVRFEAKQQIPFPLDEVVWDFQKIGVGEVTDGFALETEIGLFAMKRDMVNRYLAHFKDVGVEVHIVQMAPLSLCNYVAYDLLQPPGEEEEDGKKQCIVALDMGTDNSNLVITDGVKIIWQRPIPLGGNHFTRALTKDMKLTFAKAEHLKRNAVKSPDLKKILASLKQVLSDFVGEVQRSLGYFTNTHRDAQIQYMVGLGNGFRLPGLQKYIQEKLQLEVRKLQSFERAEGEEVLGSPTFTDNILSFAVAYGCALQGLGVTRLQTNLLPQEIRTERMIRGKKPWAVAAAAALLFGLAGITLGRSNERHELTKPDVGIAINEAKSALQKRQQFADRFAEIQAKIQQSVLNQKLIASGVDERFNWQLLHQYANLALPLPNGDRISEVTHNNYRAKQTYWSKDAKTAFEMQEKRRFAKDKPSGIKALEDEEFIRKHLVQVNIEAISSMYAEDLLSYFRKMHAQRQTLIGMDGREKQKISEFVAKGEKSDLPASGWVVEIRGYTYHNDGLTFIENTFMENLNHPYNIPPTQKLLEETESGKAMMERVKKRMSYLVLFKDEKVVNPEPGVFSVVGNSYLPALVALGGAAERPKDEGAPPEGPAKKVRDGWSPLGEAQGKAMTPGSRPPTKANDPALKIQRQPRTEFVLLFVWQEPTLESLAAEKTAEPK